MLDTGFIWPMETFVLCDIDMDHKIFIIFEQMMTMFIWMRGLVASFDTIQPATQQLGAFLLVHQIEHIVRVRVRSVLLCVSIFNSQ